MPARLREFWLKVFIFLTPFFALLIVYAVVDPFKVLWHYDAYYTVKGLWVYGLDRDFVSTQTFLNHYKENNYNAFILGNSRSLAYKAGQWQKHIGNQSCFHFDASAEGIYGIEKKLQLLDKLHNRIDYAIIVMDNETLRNVTDPSGHILVKHPALSGQNRLLFQMEFLEDFLYPKFLRAFFDYLVTRTYKPYMRQVLYNDPMTYSLRENELNLYYNDSLLASNPEAYYKKYQYLFEVPPFKKEGSPAAIADTQKIILLNIKSILTAHHTQYRIIINPVYDKLKISDGDLAYLKQLFGPENVFNFSGVNQITTDYHNYYDASHYRPFIANMIMDSIYTGQGYYNH